MSQEKVDRYKQEKANRKQIIRKQKTMKVFRGIVVAAVTVVLIGWLGYSAYDIYQEKQPRKVAEVDYSAVNAYLQTLSQNTGE